MNNLKNKYQNAAKIIIACCILLFAQHANSQVVSFIDCSKDESIEDLFVFSGNYFLGFTDKDGKLDLQKNQSIFITGINIQDTLIENVSTIEVCLKTKNQEIEEFQVIESSNLNKVCAEMMINAHKHMRKGDTSITYKFTHRLTIPDSGWSETLTGKIILKIQMLSRKKSFGEVLVCEVERSAEPEWSNSTVYHNKLNNLALFSLIQHDFMFAHQKKIAARVQQFSDKVRILKQDSKSKVEISLGGTEMSSIFNSKEIHYYDNEDLKRIEYYNTTNDTTYAGISKFYKEVTYSSYLPSFLESVSYKSITSKEGIHFVHEFNLSRSMQVAEDCLKKKIDYSSNYKNWNN